MCTGYHYHNGGSSTSSSSNSSSTSYSIPEAAPKPTYQTVKVFLNGVQQSYDQPAIIKNGRTLVPMRPVFEALGATVDFNKVTEEITATKGSNKIKLAIGSQNAVVNGNFKLLDTEAQIINGRTMVPLRFVGEAMGATVEYDGQVKISY